MLPPQEQVVAWLVHEPAHLISQIPPPAGPPRTTATEPRVRETTRLGMVLIYEPKSPAHVIDGHAAAKRS